MIDASGTWSAPNPAGADGYPAAGERAAAARGLLTYLPPTPHETAALSGLGARARRAVEQGLVDLVTGFRVEQVDFEDPGLVLVADDGRNLAADRAVVLTGFRPDLSFLSELRLELDPVLQAPVLLAPSIDPNVHSCGSVPPHGAAQLRHPEPGFYLVGMKSYGRAPTSSRSRATSRSAASSPSWPATPRLPRASSCPYPRQACAAGPACPSSLT